jgi:hypothetical protein
MRFNASAGAALRLDFPYISIILERGGVFCLGVGGYIMEFSVFSVAAVVQKNKGVIFITPFLYISMCTILCNLDIRGFFSLWGVGDLELDAVTLIQGAVTFTTDLLEVSEYVSAPVLFRDEAKSFSTIKPLYCSVWHVSPFSHSCLMLLRYRCRLSTMQSENETIYYIFPYLSSKIIIFFGFKATRPIGSCAVSPIEGGCVNVQRSVYVQRSVCLQLEAFYYSGAFYLSAAFFNLLTFSIFWHIMVQIGLVRQFSNPVRC